MNIKPKITVSQLVMGGYQVIRKKMIWNSRLDLS